MQDDYPWMEVLNNASGEDVVKAMELMYLDNKAELLKINWKKEVEAQKEILKRGEALLNGEFLKSLDGEKLPDGVEELPDGEEKLPDGKEKLPDGKVKAPVAPPGGFRTVGGTPLRWDNGFW